MKLSAIFLFAACMQVNASGFSQKITLSQTNVSLKKVFREIENQSGYHFFYKDKLLRQAENVSVNVSGATVEETLDQCLKGQPLTYSILDKIIVIKKKNLQAVIAAAPVLPELIVAPVNIVTGTLKDAQGNPLAGVSVIVKGTNRGTSTGTNGSFSIEANPGDILEFTRVGYQKKSVVVGQSNNISVVMELELIVGDEVVVVGYGTQRKRDLTGAVATVDAKAYQNQSMTQLTGMLNGTVAGLNTTQDTRADGGSSILVRGPKSLNASTYPMIVVDGSIFNGNINEINPIDIETINILKDASSAAIYGARSAAGVILITTKKGRSGEKPSINFSSSVGINQTTNDLKPYDATGYLKYRKDVLIDQRTGKPDYYFDDPNKLPEGVSLEEWRNAANNPQADNTLEWLNRLNFFDVEVKNYMAGKTVDWYKKAINSGIKQDYNISIRGGTGKINYYWSIGYTNNEGIIAGDKFSTLRNRLNIDFKVTNWLDVGVNAQFSSNDQSGVLVDRGDMTLMSPYGSEYNDDGTLKMDPGGYPNALNPFLNYYLQRKMDRNNSLFAPLYAKVKFPLGFDYQLSFQPQLGFGRDFNFWPSGTLIGGREHEDGYGTRMNASRYNWILDNIMHWTRKIGDHNFYLTLLYSAEKQNSYISTMSNSTFLPNQNLGYNGIQFGIRPGVNSDDERVAGDALMARINYGYLDRYLVTASVRRDGYSAFGQKNPRATFPAFAFAWKVSDEPFFNSNWISGMKLRVSWGVNGNRDIGAYSALAQVESDLYYNGNSTQIGILNSSLANLDLKWERTKSTNLGLDVELFKNRVEANVNYYFITTNDLLMKRILPEITGFSSIFSNLGELQNRGFEMTINSAIIKRKSFNWSTNFVFSFNRNKIISLFGDMEEVTINGKTIQREVPDYTNGWFPGQSLDVVWDYRLTGIWQLDEKDAADIYHEIPGDFKAQDVDNNGIYEPIPDKQFIGHTLPRYRFGLRNDFNFLGNFNVSMFIRADLGHIGAYDTYLNEGYGTFQYRNTISRPYWTPENHSNKYARILTNTSTFGGGLMPYAKRSFVRIQDVSFSYNLPEKMYHRFRMNGIRVYGSVHNLYSFDNWPGFDPESSMRGYDPMPRTYTIGLNLSL